MTERRCGHAAAGRAAGGVITADGGDGADGGGEKGRASNRFISAAAPPALAAPRPKTHQSLSELEALRPARPGPARTTTLRPARMPAIMTTTLWK